MEETRSKNGEARVLESPRIWQTSQRIQRVTWKRRGVTEVWRGCRRWAGDIVGDPRDPKMGTVTDKRVTKIQK